MEEHFDMFPVTKVISASSVSDFVSLSSADNVIARNL